jgi:hypothetical protein
MGAELSSGKYNGLGWFTLSLLVFAAGIGLAARNYPGGYDWLYTVISNLASHKHNPAGAVWFSSALGLSMVLLWPCTAALTKALSPSIPAAKYTIASFRLGIVAGGVVGLERLLFHDISSLFYQSHEFVALIAFLALYLGVVGLLIQLMVQAKTYALAALVVVSPLVAIGVTQFWLYLTQRDLGWVDTGWREMGVPFWFSFAFWQWLAILFLWLGLGLLLLFRTERRV